MIDSGIAGDLAEALAGEASVVGLVGPPGSGRTTLARRICARPDIVERFRGIDWISLGVPIATPDALPWPDSPAAADLTRQIVRLLRKKDGRWYEPVDPALAAAELAGQGGDRLLVVDDVRAAEQAAMFPGFRYASGVMLLITVDASLLPRDAVVVRMEPLERDKSVVLMGHEYGLDTQTAARLAARCGDRPLAVLLAGRIFGRAYLRLHDRAEASAAVPSGGPRPWADAVAALSELLPPDTRDRLQVLGVFPSDRDIPLAAVRRLWGVSRGEAHFACAELAETGLLDYRPEAAVFRLHEAIQPHLGELRQIHEGGSELRALIASGDGQWLAAAYERQGILVWESVGGSLRHAFTAPVSWATELVSAPDGSWLGSGCRFWDPRTGDRVAGVPAGTTGPHAVAPDGSWLTAASSGPADVVILDLTVPPAPGAEPGHADPVRDLEVASDGSWLATRTDSGEVAHWDAVTGRRRRTIAANPPGSEPARAVQKSLDGLAPQLREIVEREHSGRTVDHIAVSPDPRWLAVLSHGAICRRSEPRNSRLRIYDTSLARSAASMPAPHGPRGCRWSPDGSALFVWGEGGLHGFAWVVQTG